MSAPDNAAMAVMRSALADAQREEANAELDLHDCTTGVRTATDRIAKAQRDQAQIQAFIDAMDAP